MRSPGEVHVWELPALVPSAAQETGQVKPGGATVGERS